MSKRLIQICVSVLQELLCTLGFGGTRHARRMRCAAMSGQETSQKVKAMRFASSTCFFFSADCERLPALRWCVYRSYRTWLTTRSLQKSVWRSRRIGGKSQCGYSAVLLAQSIPNGIHITLEANGFWDSCATCISLSVHCTTCCCNRSESH